MIIDHMGMTVSNYDRSKAFYCAALAPLNITLVTEVKGWAGMGCDGKPEFWFGCHEYVHHPMHIAFKAESREQVDAFYQAALEAGAVCGGEPGTREVFHPDCYGAYVIDPDGHNIEAVCHSPETCLNA